MHGAGSEYIKVLPMKPRETDELLRCYAECVEFCKAAGFMPELLKLGSGASRRLARRAEPQKLKHQLAAPGDHRYNPCEKAIDWFKCHFICVLAGAGPPFPKDLWHLLMPGTKGFQIGRAHV